MAVIEVTEESVRELTDASSFERGQEHYQAGRVQEFTVDGTLVTATVADTSACQVSLRFTRTVLEGECSCASGPDAEFCAHCVAVALTWLNAPGTRSVDPLRAFLREQEREWLADELLAAADNDASLRARLNLAASTKAGVEYDDTALREYLGQVIELDGYVDFDEVGEYFSDVDQALDTVVELVGAGLPDVAADLAEYSLELLEESADWLHEGAGELKDALDRAEEIHLYASMVGEPNPVELAELLVDRALASTNGVFSSAYLDYEQVLGETGTARYRELVEQAWLEPQANNGSADNTRRMTVALLREQFAEDSDGQ